MTKLSKEIVVSLHQILWEETGGGLGIRNEALLESALENAFGGFGGVEYYPTIQEKATRLGYTIICNHAFVDGNKRTGVLVMLTFLELNGIRVQCTDNELAYIGLSVASGNMKYEELLQWVVEHTK